MGIFCNSPGNRQFPLYTPPCRSYSGNMFISEGSQITQGSPLLPGTRQLHPPAIRGPASILRRRTPLCPGRRTLRLLPGELSGHDPSLPPQPGPPVLPAPRQGTAGGAQVRSAARADHRPAQAEPVHLRHQPGPHQGRPSAQCRGRLAGAQGRRVCSIATSTRGGAACHGRPTVAAVADVRQLDLQPRTIRTQFGGLFLFLPFLAQIPFERICPRPDCPARR